MAAKKLPPDAANQLEDWKGIARYWKTASGLLTPLVALLSLSGFVFESVVCPGIEKLQSGITVFAVLLTIVFSFYWFRNADELRIDRAAKGFAVLGGVLACLYLILLLTLVVVVDEKRYLTGLSLTARAEKSLEKKDVTSVSPTALLDYFGHASEDDIWTHRGLVIVVMFMSFVGAFMGLAGGPFLWTLKSFVKDRNEKAAAARATAVASTTAAH